MGARIEDFDIKSPEEMARDASSQQVPEAREEEFQELGEEFPRELYTYDKERGLWSSSAPSLMNSIISVMQHNMREMMQGTGSAVLAQVKDTLEQNESASLNEAKVSLVKFTTVMGMGVYALRIGFPAKEEKEEELDPEIKALMDEFQIDRTPGDLTFYFPIQEDAVFDNMADFGRDILAMGMMNDFDDIEMARSPLPMGTTWVMNARQIAALVGK